MGADGLSRLPMMDNVPQASMQSLMSLNNLDRSYDDFPIDMQCIAREQERDAKIQRLIKGKKHEKNHVDTCDSCQRNKHTNKKAYGKLPLVPALRNKEPWQTVHVDCGGPRTIRYVDNETGQIVLFEVHVLGMVDAGTNWCEVA